MGIVHCVVLERHVAQKRRDHGASLQQSDSRPIGDTVSQHTVVVTKKAPKEIGYLAAAVPT